MSGETEQQVSGWTVDTLREHFQQQLDDMAARLDERYETQTKANEVAFTAQQTAMQTALSSAERLVQQAREATEKAIDKAEVAAEKRFESVNEFRGQLSDQAATFLPRTEADVRIGSLTEKVDLILGRLDRLEGHNTGHRDTVTNRRLDNGQLIAAAVVAVGLLSLVASIVIAFHH